MVNIQLRVCDSFSVAGVWGSVVTVSACGQGPVVVYWRGLSEPATIPEPVLPVTGFDDVYDRPPTEGAIDDISREPDQS